MRQSHSFCGEQVMMGSEKVRERIEEKTAPWRPAQSMKPRVPANANMFIPREHDDGQI